MGTCSITIQQWDKIDKQDILSYIKESKKKEVFYLTMHSTHFYIRLCGIGHMVKDKRDGLLFLIGKEVRVLNVHIQSKLL